MWHSNSELRRGLQCSGSEFLLHASVCQRVNTLSKQGSVPLCALGQFERFPGSDKGKLEPCDRVGEDGCQLMAICPSLERVDTTRGGVNTFQQLTHWKLHFSTLQTALSNANTGPFPQHFLRLWPRNFLEGLTCRWAKSCYLDTVKSFSSKSGIWAEDTEVKLRLN